MIQDRGVDRWRAGEHGDPHFLDQPQRLARVEHQLRNHDGAGQQAGKDSSLIGEAVEERVDDQVPIAGGQRRTLGPRPGDPERLPVGRHRAFAPARRARGEQDVADIIGSDVGGPGVSGRDGDLAGPAEELIPAEPGVRDRSVAGLDRDADNETGQLDAVIRCSHGEQCVPVGAQERPGDQQRPGLAPGDHIQRFRRGETRVHGHQRGAGIECAKPSKHPVVRVRRPDRDSVARLDSVRNQCPGHLANAGVQVLVGKHGTAGLGDGGAVGELPGRGLHRGWDRGVHGASRAVAARQASAW